METLKVFSLCFLISGLLHTPLWVRFSLDTHTAIVVGRTPRVRVRLIYEKPPLTVPQIAKPKKTSEKKMQPPQEHRPSSQEELTPPSRTGSVPVSYPWKSQVLGEEGTVVVKVWINNLGELLKAEIIESSGSERLDREALDAAKRSKFQPATLGGRPVASETDLRFDFRLSDKS